MSGQKWNWSVDMREGLPLTEIVTQAAKSMHEQGLSMAQICTVLNALPYVARASMCQGRIKVKVRRHHERLPYPVVGYAMWVGGPPTYVVH